MSMRGLVPQGLKPQIFRTSNAWAGAQAYLEGQNAGFGAKD
jgi:hypothetical protein